MRGAEKRVEGDGKKGEDGGRKGRGEEVKEVMVKCENGQKRG